MKIEKVIIQGFRSFGDSQEIKLNDMTTFVGGNGVGKTSFLLALNRFFGITQRDRQIINDDFYLPSGQGLDDVAERKLSIEAKISFPELLRNDQTQGMEAVAECFRNMTLGTGEGNIPYVRVRLEATYTRDIYGEGEIRTNVFWIRDPYTAVYATGEEEQKSEMLPSDRQRIRVIYTPASRDPQQQLKEFSGSLIGGFVKSINWAVSPEDTLRAAVGEVRGALDGETGVRLINEIVSERWKSLSTSSRYSRPKLSFIDDDVKKMLRSVSMSFSGEEGTRTSETDSLSDGERSLFYFSLLHGALSLKNSFALNQELTIGTENHNVRGSFDEEKLQFPSLTLLAIEEPENHLSPHHFGHLVESFRGISSSDSSQVIFSSHSPSIIGRVQPEDIRYFRLSDHRTLVKSIHLPPAGDQAFTYVKEAVRAYPELYFSKIVVLGEGDSEELIFRKIFEAKGLPLDRSMISIVPLAGRFVNHFWKLLSDLGIPYVTLLDLDLGKEGSGYGRVKYCFEQLIARGKTLAEIGMGTVTQQHLDQMHTYLVNSPTELATLNTWLDSLQARYDIFFSKNLDIDMMMLNSFFNNYVATILPPDRGPSPLPQPNDATYLQKLGEIKLRIFGNSLAPDFYEPNMLNYYRYFFLGKGKPLTHSLALSNINTETFLASCPVVLNQLGDRVAAILNPPPLATPQEEPEEVE